MTWYGRVLVSSRFASFQSSTAIAIAGKKSYQQPEDTEFPFLRGNWPVLLHLSRSWRTPSSEKQFTKSRKSIKSDELRSFSPAVVTSYEKSQHGGKSAHIFCYCQGHTWGLSMQCEKTNQIFTSENANLSHSLEKNEMKNSKTNQHWHWTRFFFITRNVVSIYLLSLIFHMPNDVIFCQKWNFCCCWAQEYTLGCWKLFFFSFFGKGGLRIGMNWCKLIFNVSSKILGQFPLKPS